jgi:enterochelin esterase-like enzyme
MRRMNTRQAIKLLLLALLALFSACSTQTDIISTQTVIPLPTLTATITVTPSPVPSTFTPIPLPCLSQPGEIRQDVISYTNPPQEFLVYLPPCYSEQTDLRYPVLYLLHGQTYTQDQWVRLGAPRIADRLIHSGESVSFIMVFPDDRYWYAQPGAGFGDRLILDILPHMDENYRTIPERDRRSLGGLSRGGGWVVKLGFEFPELFGSLGLHSPAIFNADAPTMERKIRGIPEDSRPRLWLDVGDVDRELPSIRLFTQMLVRNNYVHEYHLYAGDHSENYWGAHMEEYLRWYIFGWQEETPEQ